MNQLRRLIGVPITETVERTYVLGEDEVTLEVLRGRMLKGTSDRPSRIVGFRQEKARIELPSNLVGQHTDEVTSVTGYDATWIDDGFPVHEKAEDGRVWRD